MQHGLLTFQHALLISADSVVITACSQLMPRFQATLTIVDHVPPFVHPHTNLVFWHTDYPIDHHIYRNLRAVYPRVLTLYRRPPHGERLGPWQPFIPFIIFPFHEDDAFDLIQLLWKRSPWP